MLCQRCKRREATGYMEHTVNGIKTRIYVCPECFKEAQSQIFASLGEDGLFSGLRGNSPKVKCSKCGTSLREIEETCFVGCPYCYEELGEQIKPIVRNIQSAVMHVGSGPNEAETPQGNKLAQLEEQLQKAVKSENYEEALKISEQIKAIKGGKA